jgi:AcrR family transcriptional regulator
VSSARADQPATERERERPKRRRNADTRRRIEEAAAMLFTRDGYTATSMQTIATAAGCHVQTIYLAYGTKPALLAACAVRLVAGDEDPDTPPGERRWAREVAAARDPHAKLARYVQQIADVAPRITRLIDVLRATAPAEPDVATFLDQIEGGRREGALHLLGHCGIWKPGLSPEQVADITFAIASPDTLRALTDGCGWSLPEAQGFIVHALEHELLHSPPPTTPA